MSVNTPSRVLIVDDDRDVCDVLASLLQWEGYAVDVACDGQEALRRMVSTAPDVVLLDLFMPRVDGWAFDRMRRADPSLRGIPVIVMSGSAPYARQEGAIDASGWLHKPFDLDQLLDVVESSTKRKRFHVG